MDEELSDLDGDVVGAALRAAAPAAFAAATRRRVPDTAGDDILVELLAAAGARRAHGDTNVSSMPLVVRSREDALIKVFNEDVVLRVADQVLPSGAALGQAAKHGQGGRRLSTDGALRLAFRSGGGSFQRGSATTAQATTQLNVKALASRALWQGQLDAVARVISGITSRSLLKPEPFVIIARKWDETSQHLQFSRPMAAVLVSWALERLYDDKWLTADEKAAVGVRLARRHRGTVSIMVQSASIHWGGGNGTLLVPPVALQRNSARCMLAGLDAGVPCFFHPCTLR